HAVGRERGSHRGQIVEVGLDIVALPLRQVDALDVIRLVVAASVVFLVLHHSSSSSSNRKALNASAYSTPASSPSFAARSRTHFSTSSTLNWDTCCASDFSFRSMVSVTSTKVSGSVDAR